MTNVVRANKTIEDRARFGLGSDTQDDNTDPADTETALTAEGVAEAGDISDPEIAAAEVINASYRPLWSRLAADSADVNGSTALVDSGLTVTLGVGTYQWEALVLVTTAAAADIDVKFTGAATVTAGASDTFVVSGAGGTSTVAVLPRKLTAWNTQETFLGDGALADTPFVFKGVATTTVGGTFKLQFTQKTSDASNTHIDAGSHLVARKVA